MKNKLFIVKTTKKYGRGLYAIRNIKKGEIVEVSPVLSISREEVRVICSTLLNVYVFEWNKDSSALALGNGSLFNHSKKANVTYMNAFRTKEIVFMASRDIKSGQQLFIDYGYDPAYGLMVTKQNKEKRFAQDECAVKDKEVASPEMGREPPMTKEKSKFLIERSL